MRRLFGQMFRRPADALASSMGMFGQRLPGGQLIDGIVSRLVYGLSRPPVDGAERGREASPPAAPETGRRHAGHRGGTGS